MVTYSKQSHHHRIWSELCNRGNLTQQTVSKHLKGSLKDVSSLYQSCSSSFDYLYLPWVKSPWLPLWVWTWIIEHSFSLKNSIDWEWLLLGLYIWLFVSPMGPVTMATTMSWTWIIEHSFSLKNSIDWEWLLLGLYIWLFVSPMGPVTMATTMSWTWIIEHSFSLKNLIDWEWLLLGLK